MRSSTVTATNPATGQVIAITTLTCSARVLQRATRPGNHGGTSPRAQATRAALYAIAEREQQRRGGYVRVMRDGVRLAHVGPWPYG